MSRVSLRGILKESKEKNYQTDTRLTQPTTSKNTSNQNSSIINSTSSSNLSLTFMKDMKYPRLFNQSPQNPMLFSFNPSSTKNLQPKTSINRSSGLGSTNGARTPSASSSYNSFKNFFESSNKNNESKSVFGKKKLGQNKESITIDLANNRQIRCQKKSFHQSHSSSLSKDYIKKDMNCKSIQTASLYNSVQNKEQNIKVYLRIKPTADVKVESYLQRIDEKHLRCQDKIKAYDYVFPVDSQQNQVFETVAKPILSKVIEGYNGTIFAYGQTGSGKTYTIFGQQNNHGLIPLTANYLLESSKKQTKIEFSLLELYKEELIDLLNNGKSELKLKQTGSEVYVDGLSRVSLENINDFISIIGEASKSRRVTSTKINEKSSRSHTILTIYLKNQEYDSKICLIDLAGSEKINKAGVSGQALEETKKINFSLSCLGNVINALVTRKKNDHIPFRDSKLTRLLKDSLSGRFKTSIIVNCSSEQGTEEESLSSLKFADRAKKVKITISKAASKNKQNIQYLHVIIKKLTSDLENTKKQLNKYKQICQQNSNNDENEITDLTGRQTIPSERVNIDQKMKKYGKENVVLNSKKEINLDINEFSSLNVSKSVSNIFGEFSGPSVSSLSHRCDENSDDLSLNFSLHRSETNREKCE